MIFIDCFVHEGEMILWCNDGKNRFFRDTFQPYVYYETFNEEFSRKVLSGLSVQKTTRIHMDKGRISVFRVAFHSLRSFSRRFRKIERVLRDVGTFYDADLQLEQRYMSQKGLFPLAVVDRKMRNIDSRFSYDYSLPRFRIAKIQIYPDGVELNHDFMDFHDFRSAYRKMDPDIIFIHKQQKELVSLAERLGIRLNRIGGEPEKKKEGNSYFSYGTVFYRDSPVYLKGRLLVDSSGFMDDSFNLSSIFEGARICRVPVQILASHSVGAAITSLLCWQARQDGYLIPYKAGFRERIKRFRTLVECDRGALTLEPSIGMHKDVAELDFVSMFPSIISKYNLSPDTFSCSCCKENSLAHTPYHFCEKKKGVVPKVCEYLMDRRQYFKSKKDNVSKSKVDYIKWLLVVIFGFQGCRHKKIGRIEVHESINAVARKILKEAIHIAEQHGYTVIHGIVDSLYLTRRGMDKKRLDILIRDINETTGLKIECKDIFRFITFLPSVKNQFRPVPSSYYGISASGKIKVRGVEIRQRSSPLIVKSMQREMIEQMRSGDISTWLKRSAGILKNHIDALDHTTPDDLTIAMRIGKEVYKVNCVQKFIQERRHVKPGQTVHYIIVDAAHSVYVERDSYYGMFDKAKYAELLKKAMVRLFLPFGIGMKNIECILSGQTKLEIHEDLHQIKNIINL